jgi:lysophospholipase L1-like esterase
MQVSRRVLILLGLYLFGLHALVLVLVVKTNFLMLAGKTLGWIPPEEWVTDDITKHLLVSARRDHSATGTTVVLMGDSMIEQLDAHLIAPDAVNLGISGNTVRNLLWQLPIFRSIEQTPAIVLEIGTNDLKYRPVTAIQQDYTDLLRQLPTAPHIIVIGVLPVNEDMPAPRQRPYLRNIKIRMLNAQLEQICRARMNCHFLDVWPSMTSERDGGLRKIFAASDGWHLSPAGREALAFLIRTELSRLDR